MKSLEVKSKKLFSQSAKRKVSPHLVQIAWGCEIHEIGLYLILWPSEWKITRKWSNCAQCVTCRALWQIIDFFLMYPVKPVVPSTPALVGFAVVVVVVGNALQASRLCSPDTNWWLNGHVWAQDADLAWRRLRAGHRWRADILAGWFDGDKKDTQLLGPQTSHQWPGRFGAALTKYECLRLERTAAQNYFRAHLL